MIKKPALVIALLAAPALLFAQNGGLTARPGGPHVAGTVPGQQGWMGQTIQISPLRAGADTGGLDPAAIIKPLADEWRSYSGDLSGKRYSALKLVNTATVKNLSLKWFNTLTTGCGPNGTPPAPAAGGGFGGG